MIQFNINDFNLTSTTVVKTISVSYIHRKMKVIILLLIRVTVNECITVGHTKRTMNT